MRSVLVVTALALALAFGAGCGSEPEVEAAAAPEPAAVAKQAVKPAAPSNAPPVIDDVDFEPEVPVPGRPLRAKVSARDADGDDVWFEYTWWIDGSEVDEGAVGADLDLADATKGQIIDLTVVASDGKGRSAPFETRVELANRPPEIEEIDLEPGREVVSGTPVVVFPSGVDPDGDRLTYLYEWTVNGRDARAEGALLETKRMRRGDEIQVRVTANDGETDSQSVELPPIMIVNGPPRVVSVPPSDMPEGVFQYPVIAQDPDGDPSIEFRLENAPAGMRIDPYSGLITWEPSADQAGVHTVTVFAEDLHKGVGQQEFEVRVRAPDEEEAAPAEAAP
ncbi:MAG: putative Ig domain-containing protein [Myxococcota bacterium]